MCNNYTTNYNVSVILLIYYWKKYCELKQMSEIIRGKIQKLQHSVAEFISATDNVLLHNHCRKIHTHEIYVSPITATLFPFPWFFMRLFPWEFHSRGIFHSHAHFRRTVYCC